MATISTIICDYLFAKFATFSNFNRSKTKIAMKAWLLIHFLSMRERMTQVKQSSENFNGLKLRQEKCELTLLFSFYKTNFDKENLFEIKIWTINSSSFTKKMSVWNNALPLIDCHPVFQSRFLKRWLFTLWLFADSGRVAVLGRHILRTMVSRPLP